MLPDVSTSLRAYMYTPHTCQVHLHVDLVANPLLKALMLAHDMDGPRCLMCDGPCDRVPQGDSMSIEGQAEGPVYSTSRNALLCAPRRVRAGLHPPLSSASVPDLRTTLSSWQQRGRARACRDQQIRGCLEFARTISGPLSTAYVKGEWEKQYAMIPTAIELFDPKLKLTFEFFSDVHNDVPRIGMTGGGTRGGGTTHGTEGEDDDAAYEAGKLQNVDVRLVPMAIDPVVSSAQSDKEYELCNEGCHACRPCADRTCIRRSCHLADIHGRLCYCSIIVLHPSGSGVELYNVASILHREHEVSVRN